MDVCCGRSPGVQHRSPGQIDGVQRRAGVGHWGSRSHDQLGRIHGVRELPLARAVTSRSGRAQRWKRGFQQPPAMMIFAMRAALRSRTLRRGLTLIAATACLVGAVMWCRGDVEPYQGPPRQDPREALRRAEQRLKTAKHRRSVALENARELGAHLDAGLGDFPTRRTLNRPPFRGRAE